VLRIYNACPSAVLHVVQEGGYGDRKGALTSVGEDRGCVRVGALASDVALPHAPSSECSTLLCTILA
jgi:hypothetical protein